MKVATSRFGDMDIPDELIVTIPEGILGFPDDTRFAVLEHDAESAPFKWLQSVDSPQLAFIVIDPRNLDPNYRLEFDEEAVALFGSIVPDDFIPMAIVNVPEEEPAKMTANLKAPIIVHEGKRMGRQIILSSDDYSITHRIFDDAALSGKEAAAETPTR